MNREILIEHFNRISDAPEAIQRIRDFVLELAVRGKLLEQDTADELAPELYNRMQAEKARLEKTGRIRKRVPQDPMAVKDYPFPVPTSWMWVRLGDIGDWGSGSTPPRGNLDLYGNDITWLKSGELGDSVALSGSSERVSNLALRQCSFRMNQPGDVLIAMYGATIGKLAILAEPAVTNQAVCGCTPFLGVLNKYLFLFLRSRRADFQGQSEGGAQPNISREKIVASPFALPPIEEQHRIVAKVDELMGLCDLLEKAKADREAKRDRLVASSLNRISAAEDSGALKEAARFHLAHLPRLTARPEHIKQLRQAILNLAVRGRLVPQDPKDEPAGELLKRIAKERVALIDQGLIRRYEPEDPFETNELPFGVPGKWVWSRVGDTFLFTQYGTSQKSYPSENGVPVLSMGNVQDGFVVLGNEKRIPETSEDLPALYLNKFDLLYNRTNSAELVGKTGIYLGEAGMRTFASYLIRLRPSLKWSSAQFLNTAMNSPVFRETQVVPHIKKQTGQANVNGTALKNMLIPLPPLAEQHRIVARVDELMGLCDQLETKILSAETDSQRLLEAVLRDALAPSFVEPQSAYA